MTFHPSMFGNFIAADSVVQQRLFTQYQGSREDFDIIVIGSGIGGGLLADDLADRTGADQRILVLEAGSYLFPTHVYNTSRFDNAAVAGRFACRTFWQGGGEQDEHFIREAPQLNLGGRSVFWSGLIPTIQDWELEYFPDTVRAALTPEALDLAGEKMNQSTTMGTLAEDLVDHLSSTTLSDDFEIAQTPRALHQPYLTETGGPRGQYFIEPTGVFNTTELLVNQLGFDRDHDGPGLHLQIHQYVEDIERLPDGRFRLLSRTTTTGEPRSYCAPQVVLAGGSIESPKLLRRSTLGQALDPAVLAGVGRGLTDHPTTDKRLALVTDCGPVPIPRDEHAKIILYSRGNTDGRRIRFPFNIEVNVNHEYWHLRENDPDRQVAPPPGDGSVLEFKFSFANCLELDNAVQPADAYQYVPRIDFRNLQHADHTSARLGVLADWDRTSPEVFTALNEVGERLLQEFAYTGGSVPEEYQHRIGTVPATAQLGEDGRGFGQGTVHHAVGTLRMPHRPALGAPVDEASVVDEDLQVRGEPGLYVCDMSVMPLSSAANPVRTLAALALRLSHELSPGTP